MEFGSPEWYQTVGDTIVALCLEELGRTPDTSFYGSCFKLAREDGYDAEQLRAWIRESDEWKELHA